MLEVLVSHGEEGEGLHHTFVSVEPRDELPARQTTFARIARLAEQDIILNGSIVKDRRGGGGAVDDEQKEGRQDVGVNEEDVDHDRPGFREGVSRKRILVRLFHIVKTEAAGAAILHSFRQKILGRTTLKASIAMSNPLPKAIPISAALREEVTYAVNYHANDFMRPFNLQTK